MDFDSCVNFGYAFASMLSVETYAGKLLWTLHFSLATVNFLHFWCKKNHVRFYFEVKSANSKQLSDRFLRLTKGSLHFLRPWIVASMEKLCNKSHFLCFFFLASLCSFNIRGFSSWEMELAMCFSSLLSFRIAFGKFLVLFESCPLLRGVCRLLFW